MFHLNNSDYPVLLGLFAVLKFGFLQHGFCLRLRPGREGLCLGLSKASDQSEFLTILVIEIMGQLL